MLDQLKSAAEDYCPLFAYRLIDAVRDYLRAGRHAPFGIATLLHVMRQEYCVENHLS
jgi:hypothetical protein